MVNFILKKKEFNKKNSEVFKKKYFLNLYNHKFLIIAISFLILLFSSLSIKKNGFNKGIDFAGGIVVESICNDCNVNDIKKQLEKKLKTSIQHQKIDGGFLFKTTTTDNYDKIILIFKDVLKNNNAKIISTDFTSPQMTKTFIDDSIFACIFAFICLGLYVIIRFNWKFAISAIITLFYDVLITICFISFAQIEVCLITLTALLTIIGYCINDKIVIFDRIREYLDEENKTIIKIINESIKSILFRSILTSLTTCIATISLLFFGDRLIYELGLTIIFGIIVGTLSSILLAPSLLLVFKIKHKKNIIKSNDPEKNPMWFAS